MEHKILNFSFKFRRNGVTIGQVDDSCWWGRMVFWFCDFSFERYRMCPCSNFRQNRSIEGQLNDFWWFCKNNGGHYFVRTSHSQFHCIHAKRHKIYLSFKFHCNRMINGGVTDFQCFSKDGCGRRFVRAWHSRFFLFLHPVLQNVPLFKILSEADEIRST